MHAFDRRTDRQTDGQTAFSSLDRVCILSRLLQLHASRNTQGLRDVLTKAVERASFKSDTAEILHEAKKLHNVYNVLTVRYLICDTFEYAVNTDLTNASYLQ